MKKSTKKNPRPTKKTVGVFYRGVSLSVHKKQNGWGYTYMSRICKDGMQTYLGSFRTPEEAATAYNKAAQRFFGIKTAKKLGRWNNI